MVHEFLGPREKDSRTAPVKRRNSGRIWPPLLSQPRDLEEGFFTLTWWGAAVTEVELHLSTPGLPIVSLNLAQRRSLLVTKGVGHSE